MLCMYDDAYHYSALRHPNIVLFMGYTCEGDQIQIITNFVDGSDLHRVLFTEVASYCDSSNILYIASAKL